MVTREQLEKLKEPMPYKWRVQSTKFGRSTVVAYVDSRQVQDKLDECLGIGNWQNDFKLIDGKLFGGIGVLAGDVHRDDQTPYEAENPRWIWKWDTGVESNVDKEKGQVSDAFKRAAVHFGIGRFLYGLGIVTLNAREHTNKKEYPATKEGKILWNSEELNAYVSKIVADGILDDTKPNKPVQAAKSPEAPKTPARAASAPKTAKTTVKQEATTKEPVQLLDDKGNMQPNTAFSDESKDSPVEKPGGLADRQAKAKAFFNGFDKATVIKHIVGVERLRHATVDDLIAKESIGTVLAIAQRFKEAQDKK